MQSAKIVRVFVASPSDVSDERTQGCEVIRLWNAANSYSKLIIIEPVLVLKQANACLSDSDFGSAAATEPARLG